MPGVPRGDVEEYSYYIRALEHRLQRLEEGFPLCNRLLCEMHSILLSSGRGSSQLPGQFRASQNWIGGTRPGNAHFVPPPPTELAECMGQLELFLHAREDGLPMLVRTGLAHVQFETIHPFLDGNGRVGRMLITLLLCHTGILRTPSPLFESVPETESEHLLRIAGSGSPAGPLGGMADVFPSRNSRNG